MATILIVDDSILMRRNLRVLLAEAGHEVVAEASNGMEGYREYAKHLPDLVTMDITMPIMSGLDSLKKIIATYPNAKVVMISALDQKSMVFEAIQNGAMHYILKPITLEKMLMTINTVLDLPQDKREGDSIEDGKLLAASKFDQPFVIDNKNGIFIITVYPNLDEVSMSSINTAMQGFLFIKPLKVVFHFELETLTDLELKSFTDYILAIKAAGGMVGIVCPNLRLIRQMKSKDADLFAKIYTDIKEIVM
ncbi:response regulator [Paenibacillus psychroresistens]|uniref:Response regulator n=1 Tax=Paenibacillus psychroresistens TaxID=1778678 RepID=A0A6B8RLC3_9BACL|nr:response regulator [Paenibacillus psychroresistens]QGQ96343.1 response regulator [Paenibacillus psychroresistens]